MRAYKPRRASKRWLDGDCPSGVLAIFDTGPADLDRYTVFYVKPVATDERGVVWLGYRGASENPSSAYGFGLYGEMEAHKVADFRYRCNHRSARWTDLPTKVQDLIRHDLEEES